MVEPDPIVLVVAKVGEDGKVVICGVFDSVGMAVECTSRHTGSLIYQKPLKIARRYTRLIG